MLEVEFVAGGPMLVRVASSLILAGGWSQTAGARGWLHAAMAVVGGSVKLLTSMGGWRAWELAEEGERAVVATV